MSLLHFAREVIQPKEKISTRPRMTRRFSSSNIRSSWSAGRSSCSIPPDSNRFAARLRYAFARTRDFFRFSWSVISSSVPPKINVWHNEADFYFYRKMGFLNRLPTKTFLSSSISVNCFRIKSQSRFIFYLQYQGVWYILTLIHTSAGFSDFNDEFSSRNTRSFWMCCWPSSRTSRLPNPKV